MAAAQNLEIDGARVRNPERVLGSLERVAELEERIRQLEAEESQS